MSAVAMSLMSLLLDSRCPKARRQQVGKSSPYSSKLYYHKLIKLTSVSQASAPGGPGYKSCPGRGPPQSQEFSKKWRMESEQRTAEVVVTPEEERELKYPVIEEQQPARNFTPVQFAILFIQFCMVGVLLGAIISDDSDQKQVAPPPKIIVINVERERKAGGGISYRIVSGQKGGIDAIILEKLSSGELLATTDYAETNEHTTNAIQSVTGPPLLSIAKDASMPSPPVPPPWMTMASPGPPKSARVTKQPRPKEKPSTMASFRISYGINDFHRG